MAETEAPMSPDAVLRYATDQLYAVRPQPPPYVIAQLIHELEAAMHPEANKEDPPKDLDEAVSRIMSKVGPLKLKHPPDLAKIAAQVAPHAEHENKHTAAKAK